MLKRPKCKTKVPQWVGKAQRWLDENAARIWSEWCKTEQAANWRKSQTSWHVRRGLTSPYQHGFSLPEYHHDLIKAIADGNEETAKSIMLFRV